MNEQTKSFLDNKTIIMNGFSYEEITAIMRTVKGLFENPKELIFAKSTEKNLKMTLEEIIEDISGDHAYLLANPPNRAKPGPSQGGTS